MEKSVVCLKELAAWFEISYQTIRDIVSELVDEGLIDNYPAQGTKTLKDISFSSDFGQNESLTSLIPFLDYHDYRDLMEPTPKALQEAAFKKLRRHFGVDDSVMKDTPIETIYIMKHRDGILWRIGRTVHDVHQKSKAISGSDRNSFTPVFWVYEPQTKSYSRNSTELHLETTMIHACKAYIVPGERKLFKRPLNIGIKDFENLLTQKLSSLKRERLAQRIRTRDESIVRHILLYVGEEKLKTELERQAELERQVLESQAAEIEVPFADGIDEEDPYNFGLAPFNSEGWTPATKRFWDMWNSPLGKTVIRQMGLVPRPDGYKVGCATEWIVYRSDKFID